MPPDHLQQFAKVQGRVRIKPYEDVSIHFFIVGDVQLRNSRYEMMKYFICLTVYCLVVFNLVSIKLVNMIGNLIKGKSGSVHTGITTRNDYYEKYYVPLKC